MDEMYYSLEEKIECFDEIAIKDKEELLRRIEDERDFITNPRRGLESYSDTFNAEINKLLDKFSKMISEMHIMSLTEPFWGYEFEVKETGIKLFLTYSEFYLEDMSEEYCARFEPSFKVLQSSELLRVEPEFLTPEEYGALYGVEAVTVRQWIRRGKLRSAKKIGKEWKIPSTVDCKPNGYIKYHPAIYAWDKQFKEMPEYLEFLKPYEAASISKGEGKDNWNLFLYTREEHKQIHMALDGKMKEKTELFLLASENVECKNNHIY